LKVLVVDEQPMLRDGLALLLRDLDSDMEIVQAADFAAAVDSVDDGTGLILCDIVSGDATIEDGIAALRLLHGRIPDAPIVVITSLRGRGYVSRALDAGAKAYIPKTLTSEIILSAIRLVLSGGVFVPPELLDSSDIHGGVGHRRALAQAPAGYDGPSLTKRQQDVLSLLALGFSNKEVARELGVAEGTIKIHVAAIFKALGVANRTQAVISAHRLGLVRRDGVGDATNSLSVLGAARK